MNAKPNSIEIMPAVIAGAQSGRLPEFTNRTIHVAWSPPVLFELLRPLSQPCPRLASLSLNDSADDLWETLSYAALWLCGLIAVSLCFLGIARL